MSALDDIRQRAEAATEGPWEVSDANEGEWPPRPLWVITNDAFHNPGDDDDSPWLAVELHTGIKEDAEFIAHSRTDIPRLLGALDAVLALHKPEKRWVPYRDADRSYDTAEEAALDLGHTFTNDPSSMPFFEVCAHCKAVEEGPCDGECTRELGYRESLWPCSTFAAVNDALEAGK